MIPLQHTQLYMGFIVQLYTSFNICIVTLLDLFRIPKNIMSFSLMALGTAMGQPKNSLQASPVGLKTSRNGTGYGRNSNHNSRENICDAINANVHHTSTIAPPPALRISNMMDVGSQPSWLKKTKLISDSVAEHSFSATKTISIEVSAPQECTGVFSTPQVYVPVGLPVEFQVSCVSFCPENADDSKHFFSGQSVTNTAFENTSATTSAPFILGDSKHVSRESSIEFDSSTISPRKLAELINNNQSILILDCRPFTAYNANHVSGAFNIGCFNNITRKRLQDGKLGIVDIISGPEGKEFYRQNESNCEIILYDESSSDSLKLPATHALRLIMSGLQKHEKVAKLLRGGLMAFENSYSNMCSQPDANNVPLLFSPTSPSEVSCDIDAAIASEILPFLFIGNERDAANRDRLKELGITHILNVTAHLPLHFESDGIVYKRLPASDSGSQNLKQYFDEAFEFIESARQNNGRVLVHCQAGVSRSPTIVMSYMITTSRTTLTDTFAVVKERRSIVAPNLNFMGQLLELEQRIVPRTGLCVPSEPVHLLRI